MTQQQSLSPQDASALTAAFQLLQRGQVQEALAQSQAVAARATQSADAHHLVALCLRRVGQLALAEAAFERALACEPRHPQILLNSANLLRDTGRLGESVTRYRRALSLQATNGEGWMNLGLALLRQSDESSALAALARAVELMPRSSGAWQALAAGRRQIRDLEGAREALQKAVELDPNSGVAWTSLGVVDRLLGDPKLALERYTRARRTGFDSIQLRDAEAGAHLDLGNVEVALAGARALTQAAPDYAPGHSLLANILWQHRAGADDPFEAFRKAIADQPQNRLLREAYARQMLQAEKAEEALSHYEALRQQADEPSLVMSQANALRLLGRGEEAGALLERMLPHMHAAEHFRTAYARHLIRAGKPDAAAEQALLATERFPDDQETWAVLGVAWRLLDDPREHWLCDYERLVSLGDITPPDRFTSIDAYLEHLGATLTALHSANREPMNQSLRNGSQTSGTLFGRPDPVIAEAAELLRETRDGLLRALPRDDKHPYLRRNTGRARYVGSWSVRLWSSGRHINHFHPEGWLSSAFYVQLPPSVLLENSADGAIQFGQPPDDLGIELPPRRVVHPSPGKLVIFPSYMWHGTTPFEDADTPRMTIAFDAQPV